MSKDFPAIAFPDYGGQMALVEHLKCQQCGIYSTYFLLDDCSAEPNVINMACELLPGASVEAAARSGRYGRYWYRLCYRHLEPLQHPRAFLEARMRELRQMIEDVEVAAAWAWHERETSAQESSTTDDYLFNFSTQN